VSFSEQTRSHYNQVEGISRNLPQFSLKHPRSLSDTRILIYNVQGMKVSEQPVRPQMTDTRVRLPALPNGQYVLSYQRREDRVIIPFILAE
jgi:hypothetical protein